MSSVLRYVFLIRGQVTEDRPDGGTYSSVNLLAQNISLTLLFSSGIPDPENHSAIVAKLIPQQQDNVRHLALAVWRVVTPGIDRSGLDRWRFLGGWVEFVVSVTLTHACRALSSMFPGTRVQLRKCDGQSSYYTEWKDCWYREPSIGPFGYIRVVYRNQERGYELMDLRDRACRWYERGRPGYKPKTRVQQTRH
jgi:hypothetical protein